MLKKFKEPSGLLAVLAYIIIWGGCVYAAFSKSGLGAAFLMGILAIPFNLIAAIVTIPILDGVVFKIARISLLDRLLMILLVPAYTFAVSMTAWAIHNSVKSQGQELFQTLAAVTVSPISLLLASGALYTILRIVLKITPHIDRLTDWIKK